MHVVPLSVLDLSPVAASSTPRQAILDSTALAVRCDALGYTRYWVAEHHSLPNIATSAPEVLIAHIAATTTRIRVGAGGIMLPNHNPLRVVEIFRTLEALHPGRIDLGLGRAPGTDPVTAAALRRGSVDDPDGRLAELLAYANGTFPDDHPFRAVVPMPSDVALPPDLDAWIHARRRVDCRLTRGALRIRRPLRHAQRHECAVLVSPTVHALERTRQAVRDAGRRGHLRAGR